MKCNDIIYTIIFDTNVLYQSYEKKANFCSFSFNSTFKNIVDLVNELDIYENVNLGIPDVVWNEMTRQIIDAHKNKLNDFERYINKWIMPEYSFIKNNIKSYSSYIKNEIEKYKKEFVSSINIIEYLPMPSKDTFNRIIERAYEKKPPFGGKEKNSDKRFKDVLIWESILEYTEKHENSNIIFYTKDKGFSDTLKKEFISLYPNKEIHICSKEDEIKNILDTWTKEIKQVDYKPVESFEDDYLVKWLSSTEFSNELNKIDIEFEEKNTLIKESKKQLISYDNIRCISENENEQKYEIEAKIEIMYKLTNNTNIEKQFNVIIKVSCILETKYIINDIHTLEE